MRGLTYGLKPIPFKTEGNARVFQQTVKSCPDANWHTRVLPEFDLRFWAGACREVAGRSGLPGAQMRGIWGTQILLRRRIPKATGPPAHTKLESKNLIFSLLRSRKDNCRSFDSPPQAELRLGPRSLRMTLVFGALAVLPVRTFRCMAMWKVSWIESGIGIVLKTLGFWTPDRVIFVTPAHSVVR
jgi:hypothetical protein